MAKKTLSYFMRDELKTEEVIEVPGPESIKDENGNPVMFQIKRLTQEHIAKIYDNYKKTTVAMDKKNRPYIYDGKVAMKEEKDNARAFRHVIAEALVYPDLKDPELMSYFDCEDITAMPMKVFTPDEYGQVTRLVEQVLGTGVNSEEEEEEDLEAAKN